MIRIRDFRGEVVAKKDLWKVYFSGYRPGITKNEKGDKDRNVLVEFSLRPCVANKKIGDTFCYKYIFLYMKY